MAEEKDDVASGDTDSVLDDDTSAATSVLSDVPQSATMYRLPG